AGRRLERHVVVAGLEVVRWRTARRAALRGTLRAAAAATRPAASALAAAAEEHHLRVGAAHVDLGGVALVAVLVRPLVVADRPFEVDGPALRQVVAHHLRGLAEHLDAVPGDALLLLASLVG